MKLSDVAFLRSVDDFDCQYGAELVMIDGVVATTSQGGWFRSGYDVCCFELDAWRITGGPIGDGDLTVLRPVEVDHDWSGEFVPGSSHRLTVLLSILGKRAVLARAVPLETEDPELLEIAGKMQEPVFLDLDGVGKLKLNRNIGAFEGKVRWCGQSVEFCLHRDQSGNVETAAHVAKVLCRDAEQWGQQVKDFVTENLLHLWNEEWRPKKEALMSEQAFKRRLNASSIAVYPRGDFDVCCEAGGLFRGHLIQVRGSLESALEAADLAG